jgi:hypothetical protein
LFQIKISKNIFSFLVNSVILLRYRIKSKVNQMDRISLVDTAKEIRKVLKSKFPLTKFSVRSQSYSGGCSITVYWKDGYSKAEVEEVIEQFDGATFDGMTDYKDCKPAQLYQGKMVRWGVDFVSASREISAEFRQKVRESITDRYPGYPEDGINDLLHQSIYRTNAHTMINSKWQEEDKRNPRPKASDAVLGGQVRSPQPGDLVLSGSRG